MKRLMDILVSATALILLLPVLIGLMIWIRLDSPGPALFRQTRIGQMGEPFTIFKLRSMVQDAAQRGGYSTSRGDARITRAGHFVRRTSLDELPQLFNVLRGDMSLVGPRPDTPMQRDNYSAEDWGRRHLVRPGITGLAQARLRSTASAQDRLALDLEYVSTASLPRDLAILLETVRTVIFRKTY
ncbi:sugar transferase [Qipengyuania sp. ASV99]|uniref:sugar transferase n=1 Tax=Qipengyuania sp. ASV99 TaxID=3399681 RepID=UPI003A4C53DD